MIITISQTVITGNRSVNNHESLSLGLFKDKNTLNDLC